MAIDGMPAASYGYTGNGNRFSKQEGLYNANAMTPSYGFSSSCTGQSGAHAASSVSGAQTLTLSYDCNGNLTGTSLATYRYDAGQPADLAHGRRQRGRVRLRRQRLATSSLGRERHTGLQPAPPA